MKKENNEVVDIYEGKISVEERLMLLFTGILCFPIGFALYFYFKNKKEYKYHLKFARTGAWTGFFILLLGLLFGLLFSLANYLY